MAGNLWLSFAFLTASIYATLALFDKIVLDKGIYGPFTSLSLSAGPMFSVFILAGILTGNTGLDSLPSDPELLVSIAVAVTGGVIYTVSVATYFIGLETTDVSRFIPLLSTDIILVLALALVFLGETFPPFVYVGVLVIFAGTILISLEDLSDGFGFSAKALYFGSIVAATGAIINVILKYLTEFLTLYGILFWMGIGGIISVAGVVVWQSTTVETAARTTFQEAVRSASGLLVMARGVVIGSAFFTLTRALETGPVSLVIAVMKFEVFLVFFAVIVLSKLTPEVLEERMKRTILVQKFTAASLIVFGVVIIQMYTA